MGATGETALDLLLEDELEEVIRHFSEQPSHPEWHRLIRSEDLATLSRCGGALTAAAQRRINVLMLVLACEGDVERLCDVLEALGPRCTELRMVAFRVMGSPVWHAAYARHCTALRTLALTLGADAPSIDSFLAPVSATLENLRVECNPASVGALYSAVTRHCPVLKSLDIFVGFRNAPGLSKMLWAIGNSLEHLSLTIRDTMLPADLRDTEGLNLMTLARQCPKLSKLELYGDLKGARGSAEMLILVLGERLRELFIPYLGLRSGFPPRVAECCPKAKIKTDMCLPSIRPDDFLHSERPNPGPTMRALGTQLDAFTFRDGFRREVTLASDATAACKLRSLMITDIRDGGGHVLGAMFAAPRPTLEDLQLVYKVAPAASIEASLRLVACNTGALTDLAISCVPMPRAVLEVFAKTNYSLRSVKVTRNSEPDDKLDAVLAVIDSFDSAKCLRFLSTSDIVGFRWRRPSQDPQVRARCRALRRRRVMLTIDEVVCVK